VWNGRLSQPPRLFPNISVDGSVSKNAHLGSHEPPSPAEKVYYVTPLLVPVADDADQRTLADLSRLVLRYFRVAVLNRPMSVNRMSEVRSGLFLDSVGPGRWPGLCGKELVLVKPFLHPETERQATEVGLGQWCVV